MAEYINYPSRARGGFWRNAVQTGFVRAITFAFRSQVASALQSSIQREIATGFGIKHPVTAQQLDANRGYVFAVNQRAGGMAARVRPILELLQRVGQARPTSKAVIHDHAFLELLKQPNLDENGAEFMWKAVGLLGTAGRLYFLVEPDRFEYELPGVNLRIRNQAPGSIRMLEPEMVMPIADQHRWGAYYQYTPQRGNRIVYPGPPATYPEREEWKRNPYPFVFRVVIPAVDSYDGQSPVQAADNAINILYGLNKLHQNQLYNGIHSGMIFYLLQNVTSVERFTEGVLMVRQGLGKAGEPLILPKGTVEVEKSPLSNSEMMFSDLKNSSLDELLAVLGASKGVLGMTENVNRSVIEGLERMFAQGNLDPKLALIAAGMNQWLLPLYHGQSHSAWYELRFPSAAAADELTTIDRLAKGVLNSIYTPNEARAEIGLKPHPNGDKLLVGVKMQELDQKAELGQASLDLQQTALDQKETLAKQIASGGVGGPALQDSQPESVSSSKQTNQPIGNTQSSIQQPNGRWATRARLTSGHALATPEARAVRWREAMRERQAAEAELRRRLARVFLYWRASVVQAIEAGTLRSDQVAEAGDRWQQAIEQAARTWALAVSVHFARHALDRVGLGAVATETGARDEALILEATERAARFAQATHALISWEMLEALQAAHQDRLTTADTVAAVSEVFPHAGSALTRRLAAGETSAAVGAGVARAVAMAEEYVRTTPAAAPAEESLFAADADLDGRALEFGGLFDLGPAEDRDGAPEAVFGLLWIASPQRTIGCVRHHDLDGQVAPAGARFRAGAADLAYPGDEPAGTDLRLDGCRCHAEIVRLAEAGA
jgi:hypothetical protein